MKIRPVGAVFSRADGQTDMSKLIVAFRNFANAPKSKNQKFPKYSTNTSTPPPVPITKLLVAHFSPTS